MSNKSVKSFHFNSNPDLDAPKVTSGDCGRMSPPGFYLIFVVLETIATKVQCNGCLTKTFEDFEPCGRRKQERAL